MNQQSNIQNDPKPSYRYSRSFREANKEASLSSDQQNYHRLSIDEEQEPKRVFSCNELGCFPSHSHLSLSVGGTHIHQSNNMMKLKNSPSDITDFQGSLSNIEIECLNESIKQNSEKYFRYEAIANLTEQQNANLKQQNQYLLQTLRKMKAMESKIKKLYEKTQNYKSKWKQTKMQISVLKQETHLYQAWLHDYREISSIDIPSLRQKVHQTTEIEDLFIEKQPNIYDKYHLHLNGCSNKAPKFHVRSYQSIEQQGSDEERKSPQAKNRSQYQFLESAV